MINSSVVKRILFLLYSLLCYMTFLGTIFYSIGFVGNFFVSKTIDGEPLVPLYQAILVNASLLLLFALQHSIMARQGFKRWWTKFVPEPLERSTYVLLSSLCLMLLMWQWQPIGGNIWSVENETIRQILFILNIIGWAVVFISTFLLNHFDLFGLRQTWLYFLRLPYTHLPFSLPLFYRFVRHPLYAGFLIAFWSTPTMTIAHLLFAVLTTGYILIAIRLEEKDLVNHFGKKYRCYRMWTPMIIPFTKRN